jgi:hypothetical protein
MRVGNVECPKMSEWWSICRKSAGQKLGIKRFSPHNRHMRQIGKRGQSQPGFNPSEDALRLAGIHQRTGQALAALATTGIRKGIYRFATHDEMNRHSDEALARAIAANVRQRSFQGRQR